MKRVLIVDDHSLFREALARILVWDGFDESAEAGSASEGRSRVGTLDGTMDVAVVDLELPGESGMDLVKEMRETEPDVPVLVLGEDLDHDTFGRLKEMGVGEVLGKGASGEEIVSAIRRLAGA